ncbi:MAG: cytochrome b N-terminal domain-containing protein [Gemmatimonadaceae bacterium]
MPSLADRALRRVDAALTRVFGWRYHPLHQTGAVAVALLVTLIATGLYLLIFYRVGTPWTSVERLVADPYLGRWMRSLHRYASDAMVVAVLAHVLRMFAQGRSWGPRALAWVSGVVLLVLVLISGWTGFVIVWDVFGARIALAGARLFDALPILSEPVHRVFSGERPIPGAFFFVNLFLHVAVPLGIGAGLWIHVSRLARPSLLPPRVLGWSLVAGLLVLALVAPAPLPPHADPFRIAASVPVDVFYAFWLQLVEWLPPLIGWGGALATLLLALAIPRLTKKPRDGANAPSVVDQRYCTGCNQCPQDCPWEAITMVARSDARPTLVAQVDPSLCVSCGVCAGSCAPMSVGPEHRTGRDQLRDVRIAIDADAGKTSVVAIMCEHAPTSHADAVIAAGARLHRVNCTGNIHSSTVELFLRNDAAGVIIFSCPPRDCRGREGPKWLEQRLYHDREAELQPRVDKRRVRLATAAGGDLPGTLSQLRAFLSDVHALGAGERGPRDVPVDECEPVPVDPRRGKGS